MEPILYFSHFIHDETGSEKLSDLAKVTQVALIDSWVMYFSFQIRDYFHYRMLERGRH